MLAASHALPCTVYLVYCLHKSYNVNDVRIHGFECLFSCYRELLSFSIEGMANGFGYIKGAIPPYKHIKSCKNEGTDSAHKMKVQIVPMGTICRWALSGGHYLVGTICVGHYLFPPTRQVKKVKTSKLPF